MERTGPADYGLLIRIGVIVAAMLFVVVLAEPFGLLLATTAMMIAVGITCSDAPRSYGVVARVVAVSIVFGTLSHLFFKVLLRVPVLEGPVDFLVGPLTF